MKKIGYLLWLLLIGLQITFYFSLLRNLVEAAYLNEGPAWFENLIQTVYPRFYIEKYRFDLHFFLQKADQVLLRFCGIQLLVLAGLYGFYSFSAFRHKFINFWQISVSVAQMRILSILYYGGMIFFTYEWYGYLSDLSKATAFYKPLLLLRIFNFSFPSSPVILILCLILWLSCVAVIFRFRPVMSASVASFLFVVLQGWLYSFEKLDHTFSTFTYAALLMPFLLADQQHTTGKDHRYMNGWALQLICVCIAMAYLMAGLEKLLISGWRWVEADTFRAYIFMHQAPVGLQIAHLDWLCSLLAAMALLFQLGFIAILFLPRLKLLFLLSGMAFHVGTHLLLGVGGYANPWMFVYIFFLYHQPGSGLSQSDKKP